VQLCCFFLFFLLFDFFFTAELAALIAGDGGEKTGAVWWSRLGLDCRWDRRLGTGGVDGAGWRIDVGAESGAGR
jgi:hypothetical protein